MTFVQPCRTLAGEEVWVLGIAGIAAELHTRWRAGARTAES